MKFALEATLIIILVVLMYKSPSALKDFAESVLGKMISLGIIAYIAMTHGRNTGLIAAFIFILLIHNEKEGLENPPKAAKKKGGSKEGVSSKETIKTKKSGKKEGLGRSTMLRKSVV